jgi:hypothetical protein
MAHIIAVAGTFLSLIPLPTEEEAPFMSPPFLAPQQIYPYIMGYFRPPPKRSLSTVEK